MTHITVTCCGPDSKFLYELARSLLEPYMPQVTHCSKRSPRQTIQMSQLLPLMDFECSNTTWMLLYNPEYVQVDTAVKLPCM